MSHRFGLTLRRCGTVDEIETQSVPRHQQLVSGRAMAVARSWLARPMSAADSSIVRERSQPRWSDLRTPRFTSLAPWTPNCEPDHYYLA